jgi:hypothetical protein
MNYVDQDPRWQAFEGSDTGHLSDSSLIRPSVDYTFHTVSPSPHRATEYVLEPHDTFAQDCIPTPVSLNGELDVSFSDRASLPWPVSYTQDPAKGMRKEVSHSPPPIIPLGANGSVQPLTSPQKRRAQNRKAQKAFRERKDKAIQRLEEEVQKLQEANQSLSTENQARLREIAELRAELEERSSLPSSPAGHSYFEGWDGIASKRGSVSSSKTSHSAAPPPIMRVEPADICGPFIKWRGKMYIDAESVLQEPSKESG